MCACFCACTSIQYLHICIYQGAISQCPLVVYAPCAPLSSYITHDYPQEGDGTYPLGRMLSHIHKLNKYEGKSMQAVLPPLPRQMHRMYCSGKTHIDQAGGRPTAGIASWFTGCYLCFFVRDMIRCGTLEFQHGGEFSITICIPLSSNQCLGCFTVT